MSRYSLFALLRHGLSHHERWPRQWRKADPERRYDVVIVGAGGHGLATAYYLAKNHGITNVAVLERGWLGGGSVGRNTAIVRSNYLWDESAWLYDFSLGLWRGLSRELNYNLMYSRRGIVSLAHSLQDLRDLSRRVHANRLNGIDAELLDLKELNELIPALDTSPTARYPVLGAALQRRGGIARHDAVAWGYARAADALGVDIIEHCEVTGIARSRGGVTGLETTRGFVGADKVGLAVAGNSSLLAAMAGVRLPIQSFPLQAMVSEPVKPVLDQVIMSSAVHVYVSQSARGELVFGAGLDRYPGYGLHGSFDIIEHVMSAVVELFPAFSRLRMLRHWAGTVDVSPDASPIIGATPVRGLYINSGWGTGGFKATPGSGWLFAHTIAHDRPHPLNEPFALDRFATGALIDEHGAAAVAH